MNSTSGPTSQLRTGLVTREIGPASLAGLDIGMGKYVKLTSDDATRYLPKTLFRQADFHRISKPFFEVHAKLTGLRPAAWDDLQRLREFIPVLFQQVNR